MDFGQVKGMGLNNYFYPINANIGDNWIYYSFPENCNETDSILIELVVIFIFLYPIHLLLMAMMKMNYLS